MPRLLLSMLFALAVSGVAGAQDATPERAVAAFAGGCFWCVESDFDKVPGVLETNSGYTGSHIANPTYEKVSSGTTGHAESVEVIYDPSKVSYWQLLTYYWHHIDPTVRDRQFCDNGNQYRTAIFVHHAEQRKLAEASKKQVEAELKVPITRRPVPSGRAISSEFLHKEPGEI